MGEANFDIDALQAELATVKQKNANVLKQMLSQEQRLRTAVKSVEQDLQANQSEPPSPQRDRKIYLNKLRYEGAKCALEMIQKVSQVDPEQKVSRGVEGEVELLSTKMQFITLDFQLVNYQKVLPSLQAVIASTPAKPGTGALPGRSLGQPKPAAAPGAPRLGSGRLPAQTGPLAKADPLKEKLEEVAADPDKKRLLAEVLQRYTEVEELVKPMRAKEPGQLGMPVSEAAAFIKQAAGKAYYLTRAIQQLGPVGEMIPFEEWAADPTIAKLTNSIQQAGAQKGTTTGRLNLKQ